MAVRADLVAVLRETTQCTWREAEAYADLAVSWIAEQIANGERLELRGLGSFWTVLQQGGANNLPGRPKSADRYKVKFKPSQNLKKALKKRILKDKKNAKKT
jgi:nucleoid DNA-binding protein